MPAIERAAASQAVDFDVYPYVAGSTVLIPDRVREDVPVRISWSIPHPELAGRMLADLAAEWGVSWREAAERLLPAGAIFFQMDEADVRRIMAHPRSMIGSDGLPHDAFPHPRLWGTFPRVLGHYARDLGLFSLETAVAKMTGRCAEVFGLVDRGVIRPGAYADLVLFDPATVRDTATFDDPIRPADGIAETWGERPVRLRARGRGHARARGPGGDTRPGVIRRVLLAALGTFIGATARASTVGAPADFPAQNELQLGLVTNPTDS